MNGNHSQVKKDWDSCQNGGDGASESDLKVGHGRTHASTHAYRQVHTLSESTSTKHQSLLDMVSGLLARDSCKDESAPDPRRHRKIGKRSLTSEEEPGVWTHALHTGRERFCANLISTDQGLTVWVAFEMGSRRVVRWKNKLKYFIFSATILTYMTWKSVLQKAKVLISCTNGGGSVWELRVFGLCGGL